MREQTMMEEQNERENFDFVFVENYADKTTEGHNMNIEWPEQKTDQKNTENRSKFETRDLLKPTSADPNMDVINKEAMSINNLAHAENGNIDSEDNRQQTTEETVDTIKTKATATSSVSTASNQMRAYTRPTSSQPQRSLSDEDTRSAGPAMIANMFVNPIQGAAPRGAPHLPFGTERWTRGLNGTTGMQPGTWAEGLVVMAISVGGPQRTTYQQMEASIVNSCVENKHGSPAFTNKGLEVKALAATKVTSGSFKQFMSPPGKEDLIALSDLISIYGLSGENWSPPEDICLRINLLSMSLLSPKWYARETRQHMNIVLNAEITRKKVDAIKGWTWLSAPTTTDDTKLRIKAGETKAYLVTISQYLSIFTRDAGGTMYAKDGETKISNFIPLDHVVIPVNRRLVNQISSWLIPYTLAHTTTAWWNFANRAEVDITPKTADNETAVLKMTFMPKASTVVVQGSYKTLVYVITDSNDLGLDSNRRLKFSKDYSVANDGKPSTIIGDAIYSWLGRSTSKRFGDHVVDVGLAKSRICNIYGTQGTSLRAESMATELCFKIPMPKVVVPSDDNNVATVKGFTAYDISADATKIVIGETTLETWDDNYSDATKAKERLRSIEWWAVSPMGLLPTASMGSDLNNTKESILYYNELTGYKHEVVAYHVTQSTNFDKLMLGCGMVETDVNCNEHTYAMPDLFANELRCRAVLMHSMVEWTLMNLGITLMDWNLHNKHYMEMVEWSGTMLSRLTDGFVSAMDDMCGARLCDDSDWENPIKTTYGFSSLDQLERFQFMPYPFFFIVKVVEKLTGVILKPVIPKLVYKKRATGNIAKASIRDMRCYTFDVNSDPLAVNYMVQTLSYENTTITGVDFFSIHLNSENYTSADPSTIIGVNTFSLTDNVIRASLTSVSDTAAEKMRDSELAKGVLCVTGIAMPIQLALREELPLVHIISGDCHVDFAEPKTIPTMSLPLRWPDPIIPWLLNFVKDVGTSFLTGGPSSAFITGVSHLIDPIVTLIRKWEDTHMPSSSTSESYGGGSTFHVV